MIHTRSLTKDFVVSRSRTVHAVRGIDLDIAPGELMAVLGPNGAGHSQRVRDELSGGQRRRLDVAMGLVLAPSLLFAESGRCS